MVEEDGDGDSSLVRGLDLVQDELRAEEHDRVGARRHLAPAAAPLVEHVQLAAVLGLPPGARAVLYVVALVSIIFSSFHVAKCLLDASLSIAHGCSAATKSTDGTVALLGVVVIACGIAAPEVLLSIIELSSNNFYVEGRPAAVVDTGAFGLLGVSAACAMAVPAHAVRKLAAPLVALGATSKQS